MWNLQNNYHFKLDFQKNGPTRKLLINGTKRCKDNQFQNLELPCKIS